MPAATRLGDLCSGHGCWPPRPSITASDNVLVNSLGAVRLNDAYAVHCCHAKCHPGVLIAGSSSVFINGRKAGRIGDAIDCGSVVAQGSMNVQIGG